MPSNEIDSQLQAAASLIRSLERAESRFADVIRVTYDQIYDGVNTGRYRWDQLRKTEKTHFGSLIEINLQREFAFADGANLDFNIAGVDVDCKFSQSRFGWMIPVEAHGEICLVVTANDTTANWSMGLVRTNLDKLGAPNRDRKRSLNATGRESILWLWKDSEFPANVLQQLPPAVVDSILSCNSGQKRVNELFRKVQSRRIPRGTIATVAQQSDYMKRVRGNGGARSILREEGIVILGHYEAHRSLARQLDVPVPEKGESVSVRLCLSVEKEGIEIDRTWWRVAGPSDPVTRAPVLPNLSV